MKNRAIYKQARLPFEFEPIAEVKSDKAFWAKYGSEAVAASGTGGLLRAYHEAFPTALGKKQKQNILSETLDVAQKVSVAQGKLSEEQALRETNVSPETKRHFQVVWKWMKRVGVSGGAWTAVEI